MNSCSSDTQCVAGSVCSAGVCATPCSNDSQCVAGGFCDTGSSTCASYAKVATFTATPATGKVGASVLLHATVSAGTNVLYSFSYQGPNDTSASTCSYGYTSGEYCWVTPTTSGTYAMFVSVKAQGSQLNNGGGDENRTLNVTVTP